MAHKWKLEWFPFRPCNDLDGDQRAPTQKEDIRAGKSAGILLALLCLAEGSELCLSWHVNEGLPRHKQIKSYEFFKCLRIFSFKVKAKMRRQCTECRWGRGTNFFWKLNIRELSGERTVAIHCGSSKFPRNGMMEQVNLMVMVLAMCTCQLVLMLTGREEEWRACDVFSEVACGPGAPTSLQATAQERPVERTFLFIFPFKLYRQKNRIDVKAISASSIHCRFGFEKWRQMSDLRHGFSVFDSFWLRTKMLQAGKPQPLLCWKVHEMNVVTQHASSTELTIYRNCAKFQFKPDVPQQIDPFA